MHHKNEETMLENWTIHRACDAPGHFAVVPCLDLVFSFSHILFLAWRVPSAGRFEWKDVWQFPPSSKPSSTLLVSLCISKKLHGSTKINSFVHFKTQCMAYETTSKHGLCRVDPLISLLLKLFYKQFFFYLIVIFKSKLRVHEGFF